MKRIHSLALSSFVSALLAATVVGSFLANTALAAPHPESKWRPEPTNGDWNLAENWSPVGVPNSDNAQATFDFSTITDVTTPFSLVHAITFNPDASEFTIDGQITFNGGGVTNNSSEMQTFNGTFRFDKGATGGNELITYNSSSVTFYTGSSAGSATYVNNGTMRFSGTPHNSGGRPNTAGDSTIINHSSLSFRESDAGTATITNDGGTSFGEAGATTSFVRSGAGASTIISHGGQVFGARGAQVSFSRSDANSATLIANGGAGPGSGAKIVFRKFSSGDLARIEIFGNGNLDVSRPDPSNDSVGSIEGDGLIFLGSSSLNVGANDLSTTFDGVISDMGGIKDGTGGSLIKSGAGDLTLTNDNTYTGGTTVSSGTLFVNNPTGSGTGSGPVAVNAGTFGGNGASAGSVTIGVGNGAGATLAAGAAAGQIGTFATSSSLAFNADGLCSEEVNSTAVAADETVANGVSIAPGSRFALTDLGNGSIPTGTVFIVISNTSATPIAGTFANLGDGSTTTVGANNYQASYDGGDGNDLTLTVVP